jgi:alpha-beta hydrolase superfamily lysophospholipase
MTRLFAATAAALAVLIVMVTAPAGAATAPGHGSPVRVEPLPESQRLAGTGTAWRVWYRSTSWNERSTVVSGTVNLPAGRPPAGGWPVVSFAPGFGGTPDACAHSRAGTPPFVLPLAEALLAAGYAVVVTDYEGIGTPGESSVVDGPSEAYAVIDIVSAARRLAPVSRSWVAIGYSLGGHAALFAGAIADSYAPGLRHTGTIALAATTQWALQFAAARDPRAPVNPAVPYLGRTLPVTHPGEFRPADVFTVNGLRLVRLAGQVCVEQMAQAMAGLTSADVFIDVDAALDEFTALFAEEEVPVQRYRRPVRLVHGTADLLPAVVSEITAGQLAAAGTDVAYVPVAGADHFTVLAAATPQVLTWTDQFLARG